MSIGKSDQGMVSTHSGSMGGGGGKAQRWLGGCFSWCYLPKEGENLYRMAATLSDLVTMHPSFTSHVESSTDYLQRCYQISLAFICSPSSCSLEFWLSLHCIVLYQYFIAIHEVVKYCFLKQFKHYVILLWRNGKKCPNLYRKMQWSWLLFLVRIG